MKLRNALSLILIALLPACSQAETEAPAAEVAAPAPAADTAPEPVAVDPEAAQILFSNVNVFDGKTDEALKRGMNVLVAEGKLHQVDLVHERDQGRPPMPRVIDGDGRTLMPGLIDGHAHMMINDKFRPLSRPTWSITDLAYHSVTVVAERFLMDGFTAVRDMGGPDLRAPARTIDTGIIIGPRVYPIGWVHLSDLGPRRLPGDGATRATRSATRTRSAQLRALRDRYGRRRRAGGARGDAPEPPQWARARSRSWPAAAARPASIPIDTTQYSVEETCAIVEAAADWGTYVGAHVFTIGPSAGSSSAA